MNKVSRLSGDPTTTRVAASPSAVGGGGFAAGVS